MLPSEEIKDKINIVDLVGETVKLKKAGANYRGLCPFHHEKTPSFMGSPTKQIWHCFGCSLGGDMFEFVKLTSGVEFPEALQILAARAGITLKQRDSVSYQPDQKNALLEINNWAALYYSKILNESQAAKAARDYIAKRGLKPETLAKWQIGYAPDEFHAFENFITKKGYQKSEAAAAGLLVRKDNGEYFDRFRGRVMFPLFDLHGRVVGFTGRILPKDNPPQSPLTRGEAGTAKYVNSPETNIYSKSRLIYGLHLAKTEIRKSDEVVVVEGNVDVITCHESGFGNVVGSSGTAFTPQQLDMLKRFTSNISFAFDVDEAGLTATRRAVELALAAGFNVKVISIPKQLAKDPDELIRKDAKLWQEQVASAKNFLDFYFDSIFANIDLQSNTGKKQAVAELLPLLSLLPDPVDRAHYVQKLSTSVGVDEKIILDLLNRTLAAKAKPEIKNTKPTTPLKSQREILERKVLGLLLKFARQLSTDWQTMQSEDFQAPLLREIFAAAAPAARAGQLELEHCQTEQAKYAQDIELLVFAVENELSMAADLSLDDLKKSFFTVFQMSNLKQKMKDLTFRIKQAEAAGSAALVKNLSTEFNNLTQELSKYHV